MSDPVPSAERPATAKRRPSRRRRILRWMRRALIALVAVVLAAVVAAVFLLLHPVGVRSLLDRAGPLLGGELTYDSAAGRLLDAWSVEGLRFRQMEAGEPTGLELAVDRLAVEWSPRDLPGGAVELSSFQARGVTVTTPPSDPSDDEPFELPDLRLPVAFHVDQGRIEELVIRAGDGASPTGSDEPAGDDADPLRVAEVAVRRLTVAPNGGPITVERLAVDAPAIGALELGGEVRPVGDYPLDLEVSWVTTQRLGEDQPPLRVSGGGRVEGALGRELELDLEVAARPAEPADAEETLRATVDGTVGEPLGDPVAELELAWSRLRWPLDEVGDALVASQGEVHVSGDLERIELDGYLQASGPQVPESELELRGSTDLTSLTATSLELRTLGSTVTGSAHLAWAEGVSWSAELEGRDLDPSVKWPEWPGSLAVDFAGSGTIEEQADGQAEPQSVARIEAQLRHVRGTLRGYPVSASGQVLVVGDRLEDLDLQGRSGDATFRLAGSVRERAEIDFRAEVPDLSQVLPEASGTLAVSGHLSGDRDAPGLDLDLSGAAVEIAGARLADLSGQVEGVVARGGELHAQLAISELSSPTAEARDVELQLDGTLGGLDVDSLLRASEVDLRLVASALRAAGLRASGVAIDLEGTLADHRLALAVDSAAQEGGQQTAQRLRVRAAGGASQPSLDGSWSGTLEEVGLLAPGVGRWALDDAVDVELSRDLVEVGEGCWRREETDGGQPSFVCGQARWSSTEPWSVDAQLSAIPLDLLDPLLADSTAEDPTSAPTVRSAELEGRLDGRVEASGVGRDLRRARAEVTGLDGVLRAELASGETVEVPFRDGRATAQLEPGSGTTARARLALPAHEGALSAQVELPGFTPGAAGWTPGADQTVTGSLDAEVADIGLLAALVPGLREPRGRLLADLVLAGTVGEPLVTGELDLSEASGQLALANPSVPDGEVVLRFSETALAASLGPAGVGIGLSMRSEDPAGTATGSLELPDYRLFTDRAAAEQPVRGRIELALEGIAPLAALLPQLADVDGTVDGSFEIAGTLGSPELDGRADLREFSARIPELDVELRDGSATIQGTPGESLTLTAAVRSGPGILQVDGTVSTSREGQEGWLAELRLTGEEVTVANTPEIRVRASPDLTVTATAELIDVRGEVRLPWARIEIRELPEQAIEPSADIVRVDLPLQGEAPIEVADRSITGRIRVVFGDDFQFEGFGFDVEPTGSLLITETGRGSTTATGQLQIDGGRYRAYGQNLEITEGRVVFGGPIQNPAVSVEAYRTVGTVQAGVRVSGNLQRPIVHLTSNPAMPESDILHYMMLGRPPGAVTTSEEGDLLTRAAASLGIRGGNRLARKLAARYDLDELGIETEEGIDSASLVVGKYLSPRLYVSYGIGLFEPISTITVRYILSSKWTLSAEKGRGTGADLVYTIETGKRDLERTEPPDDGEPP